MLSQLVVGPFCILNFYICMQSTKSVWKWTASGPFDPLVHTQVKVFTEIKLLREKTKDKFTYAFEQFDLIESCFSVMRSTLDHFEGDKLLVTKEGKKRED